MPTCWVFIPQGILLVYDITNGWSFDGIDRWIREIDEVISFIPFVVDRGKTGNEWEGGLCPVCNPSIPEEDHCLLISTAVNGSSSW